MLSLQTKIENDHCHISASKKMTDPFLSIISVAEECEPMTTAVTLDSEFLVFSRSVVKVQCTD